MKTPNNMWSSILIVNYFGITAFPLVYCLHQEFSNIPWKISYKTFQKQSDILLTGSSEEEHLSTLQSILQRLESASLKLRRDKCEFLTITYLGHRIDSEGLHPLPDKMDAILNAPAPTSVTELKTFNLAKQLLLSNNVLIHFDPTLDFLLSCNTSEYGIDAVLAHCLQERPIGFVSRTLSEAERSSSQIEKQTLSCVFLESNYFTRTSLFASSP